MGPYLDGGHQGEVANEDDAQLRGHVLHDGPALTAEACRGQRGQGASTWGGCPAFRGSHSTPGAQRPGAATTAQLLREAAGEQRRAASSIRGREKQGAEMSTSERKAECHPLWHIRPPRTVLSGLHRPAHTGQKARAMEVLAVFFLQPLPHSKHLLAKGPGPLVSSELPIERRAWRLIEAHEGLSSERTACPRPRSHRLGVRRRKHRVQTSSSRLSAHFPQHPDPPLWAPSHRPFYGSCGGSVSEVPRRGSLGRVWRREAGRESTRCQSAQRATEH